MAEFYHLKNLNKAALSQVLEKTCQLLLITEKPKHLEQHEQFTGVETSRTIHLVRQHRTHNVAGWLHRKNDPGWQNIWHHFQPEYF